MQSLRLSWPYLLLAAASALFLFPFVRTFTGAPDYGVFLNGADLLNHGAIPSRDFVEPQGPGSFLWLALFFRIFGTTIEVARTLLTLTGVATVLLIFHLSRKLGGAGLFPAAFVAATGMPILPINSPHYDSNLFALAALTTFVSNNTYRVPALLAPAILCGITTTMIQQKGCYLAAALLVSLFYLLRKKALVPAAIFAVVFATVALSPFLYLAARHVWTDVWFANFVWPMQTYSNLNAAPYGFPVWDNLRWSLEQHATQPAAWISDIAFAMPFALIAALPLLLPLAARWSRVPWFTPPLLPYWLCAYALWFSELHRVDIGHLRNGVILMVALFFTICERSTGKSLKRIGFFFIICLAMAATLNFGMSWQGSVRHETRRGTIYTREPQPLLDYLASHTHAGDEVFVYPYQPIYYFLEDLKNPTRYSYLNYHFHTGAQFLEATRDLEHKQVRMVIFDTQLSGAGLAQMFPAYRHPEKSKLIMEPYLEQHYRLAADLGRFHILERLHDSP